MRYAHYGYVGTWSWFIPRLLSAGSGERTARALARARTRHHCYRGSYIIISIILCYNEKYILMVKFVNNRPMAKNKNTHNFVARFYTK